MVKHPHWLWNHFVLDITTSFLCIPDLSRIIHSTYWWMLLCHGTSSGICTERCPLPPMLCCAVSFFPSGWVIYLMGIQNRMDWLPDLLNTEIRWPMVFFPKKNDMNILGIVHRPHHHSIGPPQQHGSVHAWHPLPCRCNGVKMGWVVGM